MTDAASTDGAHAGEPSLAESLGLHRYHFTPAKIGVLTLAAVLVVAGGITGLVAPPEPAESVAQGPTAPVPSAGGEGTSGSLGALQGGSGTPGGLGALQGGGGDPSAALGGGLGGASFGPSSGGRITLPGSGGSSSSGASTPEPDGGAPGPAATTTDTGDPAPTPTGPVAQPARKEGAWSTAMLRGGFGLFIGFAMGYAIRAFIKLATVITGFYFLALTMMAYFGWVEIHWEVMGAQLGVAADHLQAQFQSFQGFLAGTLPSAGLATLGLGTGLKQK